MPLPVGECLGPYRIAGILGSGGMGEVYRARDLRLERDVAVKVLKDRKEGSDKEARAAAALNHPNIVAVYDIGPGYVVMELVDGEPLRHALRRGPLPFRDVIEQGAQIAEGLAAAHAAHVIHRDLKPENIVIARGGRPKILDFGLAKRTTPGLDESTQTNPGTLMGTAAYMSPEQVRGLELDWRSDIFSLGVVLFEMMTGRHPFAAGSIPEMMAAIVRDAPADAGSGANAYLQAVVLRCLEKSPDRRFQSAQDLAFSLRALAANPSDSVARPSETAIDSLAVMPFENLGGSSEDDYLSDGITESLINSLTGIAGLRVIARSRVFRYKGKDIDPAQTGRDLNVRALLTGFVARRGDSLRIQVELVEASSQTQLWGERFHRPAADLLAMEEEIATQISAKLRLKLSGGERERLVQRSTQNTEAYHLYLKGRYHWNKRTKESLQKAIEYFRLAIEADPAYALAYAGLADGYLVLGFFMPDPAKGFLAKGRAAGLKALEIDPDLPEARTALSPLRCAADWDWAAAEADARRSVELKPGYWLGHSHLALLLSSLGRHEEAMEAARHALDLEPLLTVVSHHFAWVHIRARRYQEAAEQCRRAFELDPVFPMGHYWLGLACGLMGRHAEAIDSLQEARRTAGSTFVTLELARAYASAERTTEALVLLAEMHRTFEESYAEPYGFATVYAALGETDRAFEWLDRACRDRTGWLATWVNGDPRLDALRADPRMSGVLRRVGLQGSSSQAAT
jgi:serine/threonine protein kinase/Tfp pilus assembly protein PilF